MKANSSNAHEFWMEPNTFFANQSETIEISNRIGQNFVGDTWPYISNSFYQFEYRLRDFSVSIISLEGDDPAAKLKIDSAGLAIITQYTKPDTITFTKWGKFNEYLRNEGISHKIREHVEYGFPKTNIKEKYYRCAKLLLNIHSAPEDFDQFTGMPLEIIAEKNPYHLKPTEQIPVRILYKGKPLPDAQTIKISKNSGIRAFGPRTDKDGRALLNLKENGPWLISVVHLIATPKHEDTHWVSYWASLTLSRQ